MNTELWVGVIGAAATLIVGIVAVVATAIKVKQDLQAAYDLDLRAKRLEVYQDLCRHLAPLAAAQPSGRRPHVSMQSLAQKLTDWYYGVGGLLLSGTERPRQHEEEKTPDPCLMLGPEAKRPEHSYTGGSFPIFMDLYWDVQLAAQRGTGVDEPEFACLQRKGSRLRTALTQDVGSRRILNVSGESFPKNAI